MTLAAKLSPTSSSKSMFPRCVGLLLDPHDRYLQLETVEKSSQSRQSNLNPLTYMLMTLRRY